MIPWAGRQEQLNLTYWQRVWILLYPWLIYMGATWLVLFCFAVRYMLMNPDAIGGAPTWQDMLLQSERLLAYVDQHYVYIAILSAAVSLPLFYLFYKKDRQKEMREGFVREQWQPAHPASLPLSLLLGAGAAVTLNHVLIYSGIYDLLIDGFSDAASVLYQNQFWLELLGVGIIVPMAEEMLFRGLIYRRIRWQLDAKAAIPFSAFLFALFHMNLLQGIYAFLIGLLLAFAFERTHNIWVPVLIHVGANILSVLLSEISALQAIYDPANTSLFIGVSLGAMVIFVLVFYVFLTRIHPERMDEGGAPVPDGLD